MRDVPEIFGSLVFNDSVMSQRLPAETYESLHKTIEDGKALDLTVANAVAAAMKDWAIEQGATHYTHWFQPLTGITAEKHDSFLSPQSDGRVIMEFSGKELIKGEPDASSFPSGGLRATFEARGYTAWDPTSYAFIKDDSLCIPTVFCSYSGEVLDTKTPLLRSMEVISAKAVRLLRLLGDEQVQRVNSTVGAEQEYFLIDKDLYNQRKDIVITGRSLFGAKPPKGQELDDHYFGAIKPTVMAYMQDLNEELWKLGVYAKTEHNEAAPAQHELAPVYASTNMAVDHNQLTMEMMKKVAERHGLACLLHEKPFEGVNGSGKHNNWSLSTGYGKNLFNPGKKPQDNLTFLVFLCAVIAAVDRNQDLLRISAASAGNDHRLGASEAPPAILSVFLGDELSEILDAIEKGEHGYNKKTEHVQTGVEVLPDFRKDTADRNRTSPFAFTGNKFEFRMIGSSFSVADANIVLNTAVADVLDELSDRLDGQPKEKIETIAYDWMAQCIKAHKRIIYNGNNYSEEWVAEAERRGLYNLRTTADAVPLFVSEKNVELFTKHHIFTRSEIASRCEIMLDNYCKIINIEALTMLDMAKKEILPAVLAYANLVMNNLKLKKKIGLPVENTEVYKLNGKLSELTDKLSLAIEALEATLHALNRNEDNLARSAYYRDFIVPAMEQLRVTADKLEEMVAEEYWPYPTYNELLFRVK
ncbi:MAG TPA: glutamine synthetase type III [Ruminococcaceae bacterium]|nr:glutamine synthetase type III [Oscillospiraceae bacterium]